jgi:GT2 family glycosyltransferase
MDLSVVIVNWKTRDFLPGCLESLKGNIPNLKAEIVFVDNGSHDGSLEWIGSNHPDVKVIVNEANLGFSKANNLAIERCQGDMIMLLNPDTRLKMGAVEALVSLLNTRPAAGIVGPRIEYPDGSLYPQSKRAIPEIRDAFFYIFRIKNLAQRFSGENFYTLDDLDPDEIHEVGAVSGSCMLVRREVFTDVGLLDEDFFLYGEDLDICMRSRRGGWKVYYCPDAVVVHYHGQSSRKRRLLSTLDFYGAMRTFYRKHYAPFRHPLINGFVEVGIHLKMLVSLFLVPLRPGRRAG